jgi:ubiquitin carboxyl-terminal hydrolase 5/13
VEPDPAIVAQLMSMGFGENGSKRAAIATQVASTYLRNPKTILP